MLEGQCYNPPSLYGLFAPHSVARIPRAYISRQLPRGAVIHSRTHYVFTENLIAHLNSFVATLPEPTHGYLYNIEG